MRLAGIAKGGYYPTPKRCVELLSELISVYTPDHSMKQETLRIIDPCCGPGDACETLASKLSTKTKAGIKTYGVELEQKRSDAAREQMDFALSSDIFQTTIANNSFHLLYLNPPYDFDQESKRVEHAFLLHCTKYLVDGGITGVRGTQAPAGGIRQIPGGPTTTGWYAAGSPTRSTTTSTR